jgi:hypothetical protein
VISAACTPAASISIAAASTTRIAVVGLVVVGVRSIVIVIVVIVGRRRIVTTEHDDSMTVSIGWQAWRCAERARPSPPDPFHQSDRPTRRMPLAADRHCAHRSLQSCRRATLRTIREPPISPCQADARLRCPWRLFMRPSRPCITLSSSALFALAAVFVPIASVAQSTERTPDSIPVAQATAIVAQAPASASEPTREAGAITVVAPDDARPAVRRGLRWGILEGADAARVYNARKQAVYNTSTWEMPSRK